MIPTIQGYKLPWDGRFSEIPAFQWSVRVHARCRSCGKEAIVGSNEKGATIVVCSGCKKCVVNDDLLLRNAAPAICEIAAANAKPPAKD